MKQDDDRLIETTNQALDARARGLDGATLSRLHQARVRAVEQGRHRWFGLSPWSAGGLATAAVVLLAVLVLDPSGGSRQQSPAQPPQQVAAQSAEPDLLEDLDFYNWLADKKA